MQTVGCISSAGKCWKALTWHHEHQRRCVCCGPDQLHCVIHCLKTLWAMSQMWSSSWTLTDSNAGGSRAFRNDHGTSPRSSGQSSRHTSLFVVFELFARGVVPKSIRDIVRLEGSRICRSRQVELGAILLGILSGSKSVRQWKQQLHSSMHSQRKQGASVARAVQALTEQHPDPQFVHEWCGNIREAS